MAQCCVKINEPKEILGLRRITKKRLLELCKKNRLYQTPSLNDVLYLHYQGFQCIECLEEYTELKCLWLECNAISEIQGLDNQTKLKCLFLQSNLIQRIENLEACKELDTLNLSQNHIKKIENCNSNVLPVLNTLNLSSNYLRDSEGLKDLENCKTLSVLDLSNNRIDDILVVKIFAKMPGLKVLVLQGNPVVSKIPQYRKTIILECKNLTYLDSRPVFPKDRACAEAWKRGGYEEERKENARWNRRERNKITESVNATIRMRNRHRGPDDQLELFPLSDSEDENARATQRQHDVDLGVSMEMGMWDEVADAINETHSPSSSDMNVSSSTSALSSTDSNGQDSSDVIAESLEIMNNTNSEQKLLNTSAEKNVYVKVTYENENPDQNNDSFTENGNNNGDLKEVNEIKQEPDNSDLEIFHTDAVNKDNFDLNILNISTETDEEYKQQFNDTVKAISQISITNNCSDENEIIEDEKKWVRIPIEYSNSQEDLLDLQDDKSYEPLKFLDDLMESLTEPSVENPPSERNLLPEKTEADYKYEKECIEVNNEVQKNLEKLSTEMDLQIIEMYKDRDERRQLNDVFLHGKYAANDKEHNSSSSSSISSVNRDIDDERERNLEEEYLEEKRIQQVVDQWDKETKYVMTKSVQNADFNGQHSNVMKDIPEIWLNDKPIPKENDSIQQDDLDLSRSARPLLMFKEKGLFKIEFQESDADAYDEDDVQDDQNKKVEPLQKEEDDWLSKEHSNTRDFKDSDLESNIKPNIIQDFSTKKEEVKEMTIEKANHELDKPTASIDPEEFEYKPLDVSALVIRAKHSINENEKASDGLKKLLQKLEDDNEELYKDINTGSGVESMAEEQNHSANKNYNIKDNNVIVEEFDQQSFVICREVIEDLIESLNIENLIDQPKPKSYEFGVIESDDEYHYGTPEKQEDLPPNKTLRGVVDSFNTFIKEISARNRQELKNSYLNKKERKIVPSTSEEKSISLQTLLEQPNLKEFNKDSHETLDAKLEKFEEKKTNRIKRMVDRIYAQKDRYNDNLEVIDGTLKRVRWDTGVIEELNKPIGESYESDDETSISDYHTAESDDEENLDYFPKSNSWPCKENYNSNADDKGGSYKPISRNIDGVQFNFTGKVYDNDKEDKYNTDDEAGTNDSSGNEYHSFEDQPKSQIFSNIDDEFFNKWDLNNIKISEEDEHRIVQCARSYREIRKYLKIDKGNRSLTEEENNLLKEMENIQDNGNKHEPTSIEENAGKTEENIEANENASNNVINETDLLLEKLLQRTKERMEKEEHETRRNTLGDAKDENVCSGMVKPAMCSSLQRSIELYEYKFEDGNCINLDAEMNDECKSVGGARPQIYGSDLYTFVYDKSEVEQFDNDGNQASGKAQGKEVVERTSEEEKNELEDNFDVEAHLKIVNSNDAHNPIIKEYQARDDYGEFKELVDDVNVTITETCLSEPLINNRKILKKKHVESGTQGTQTNEKSVNSEEKGAQFDGNDSVINAANNNNNQHEIHGINQNNPDNNDNQGMIRDNEIMEVTGFANSMDTIPESEEITMELSLGSFNSSIELVECTLEVLNDNDETIDTIAINAEVTPYQ